MKYEIRKITNTSKSLSEDDIWLASEHRGYVIARDWDTAEKKASDAGLVRTGEGFYAIPAYATLWRKVVR